MSEWEESMQYFRDKGFFQFEDLDPESQEVAKIEVTKSEKQAFVSGLKEAKEAFKLNPNKAINDPYHIKRILNGSQAYRKIKIQGDSYLIKLIKSNLIWFNLDGTRGDIFK